MDRCAFGQHPENINTCIHFEIFAYVAHYSTISFCPPNLQLSAMSKTGDKGSVIITSSIVATKTFAKCDLYGSSKAAAAMLVR